MTRSQYEWFAVLMMLVLLVVFLAFLTASPAKSTTSQAWRPVPAALFSRWPAVPVDAGGFPGPSLSRSGRGQSSRTSSIHQSGRQRPKSGPSATEAPTVVRTAVGGLIPPYVAEKGVAGIATWYRFVPGQAAAAARLRDVLGPGWRGLVVRVDGPFGHLYVRLTDFESSLIPGRLIDLSSADFLTLCGPLSRGICSVEVTR